VGWSPHRECGSGHALQKARDAWFPEGPRRELRGERQEFNAMRRRLRVEGSRRKKEGGGRPVIRGKRRGKKEVWRETHWTGSL